MWQDNESAETGTEMELGGGVRLANPTWHLRGVPRHQEPANLYQIGWFLMAQDRERLRQAA